LPEALLESELFGVEKGAYTGADRSRKGRFEMAESGSILLDEIGDMELNLQAKLLRVLQNKTIEPLGSTKSIDIDTRVIASTNQDLSVLIKEGKFREDLYFRLNVVNIKLPALREKKEDIIPLSEHFLVKYNKDFGKSVKGFAKEVVEKFQNYNWPGNVRELENAVQHSVIFCENEEISLKDLPDTMFSGNSTIISGTRSLEEIEKQHILNILSEYGHNISKASNILGIDRKTLYNKMKKYGLSERQRQ
jgi:transcriptional regulator with PAS, ATPase and Fis domain